MSSITIQLAEQLSHTAPQLLFNLVATTVLLIWDILLTLDEEIRFLWSTKFSFVKVVFVGVRYLVLLLQCGSAFAIFGTSNMCSGLITFIVAVGATAVACSDILLIQRVYAFYERNRFVLWFLSLVFAINQMAIVVIMVIILRRYDIVKNTLPMPFPSLIGNCVAARYPETVTFVWLPEIIFQSVAFACVVARFVYTQYVAWQTGVPNSRLYAIFLRDGIWVFLITFVGYLFTAIYEHRQSYIGISLTFWSFTVSSICSTRLILNLNSSVKNDGNRRVAVLGFLDYTNDVDLAIQTRL